MLETVPKVSCNLRAGVGSGPFQIGPGSREYIHCRNRSQVLLAEDPTSVGGNSELLLGYGGSSSWMPKDKGGTLCVV